MILDDSTMSKDFTTNEVEEEGRPQAEKMENSFN